MIAFQAIRRSATLLARVFILLLLPNQLLADDWLDSVTYNITQPPGSLILRYGGLEGLIREETQSQLFNLWASYNSSLYQQEVIDFNQYRMLTSQLTLSAINCDVVGLWWERRWYESLGPPTKPSIYYVGNQSDIINVGFARVNSKFKFKLEDFDIDLDDRSPWEFKIRPVISVGSRSFFQYAEVRFIWNYLIRRVSLIDIQVAAGYKYSEGFYGGIFMVLPQW